MSMSSSEPNKASSETPPSPESIQPNAGQSSGSSEPTLTPRVPISHKDLPIRFSQVSSLSVPESLWFASDFLLGAGMVIFQRQTQQAFGSKLDYKVVVVHDSASNSWFLPKGRKDVGESLEECALREAYEESGYKVEFMPIYTGSRAPQPPVPGDHNSEILAPIDTEAIAVFVAAWGPRWRLEPVPNSTTNQKQRRLVDSGGEYLTHWYVGEIAEDAVREKGTGMPDEQGYVAHLLGVKEAMRRLGPAGHQSHIVEYANCLVASQTTAIHQWMRENEERTRKEQEAVDERASERQLRPDVVLSILAMEETLESSGPLEATVSESKPRARCISQ